jgi:hypothetical protein
MSSFTQKEKDFLIRKLNQSVHYLEFGAGESTILASQSNTIKTINCVETCKIWADNIRKKIKKSAKIDYVDVNSNCTGYGRPIDDKKKHNWPIYQEYSHNKEYDLCLIDGRFRVASFLNSYLNAKPNCCLLIHDYQRKNYKEIEKAVEIHKMVDTFGVFFKQSKFNNSLILEIIEKYKNNWE